MSRDWPAQEAEEPLRLWKACILFIARALRGPASGLGPTLGEILGAFDLRWRPTPGPARPIGQLGCFGGKGACMAGSRLSGCLAGWTLSYMPCRAQPTRATERHVRAAAAWQIS